MLKKKKALPLNSTILLIIFLLLGSSKLYAAGITLSWTAPVTAEGVTQTDVTGYKIHYGTASGSYTNTIDAGNVISYQVPNMTDGVVYFFTITSYDASGRESGYSTEVSKTTQSVDTVPPALSGIYTNNVTSSTADIHWTTDELSDTQVEYGTTTAYGYTNPLDTTMVTSHSQSVAGLVPSTQYNYRVMSYDAAGNLAVSGNYTFTTSAPADTTAPVISNIQVTGVTASGATITWTTDEASTSQVDYGLTTSYGASTALDATMVTSHTVLLTGLSGYTPYDFVVRSKDPSGNEAVSLNNTFTTSNTAPAVSSISVSPSSGLAPLTVTLSAQATDSDGYISTYEWDFDGDGNYDFDSGTLSSTTYTYSVAGSFSARVRVTDNGGASNTSNAVSVTVSSTTNQPPTISHFTATPSGTSSLDIQFSVSASDPDGSIVLYEWDFDGDGTYDATTSTAPVSYTYGSESSYTARVRVTDDQGATATAEADVTVVGVGVGTGTASSETNNGGGCFIASAAYGSYLEPNVMVLRKFRDRRLLTNSMGRAFVAFYYRVSPPLADVISRHRTLKIAVRIGLTPLVYGLKYSYISLFCVIIGIVSLMGYLVVIKQRKSLI